MNSDRLTTVQYSAGNPWTIALTRSQPTHTIQPNTFADNPQPPWQHHTLMTGFPVTPQKRFTGSQFNVTKSFKWNSGIFKPGPNVLDVEVIHTQVLGLSSK